jgi:hypothetical protein
MVIQWNKQRQRIILGRVAVVKSTFSIEEPKMPEHLMVVYTAASPGEADIVKGSLLAAGIPAETSREGAGAAYGFTVGPLGMVDILVPAQHAAQATELLAAMRRGDLTDDSDAMDEDA